MNALAPAWNALVARSGYELPFATFAWSSFWWYHFVEQRTSSQDRLSVRGVWRDNELVAIAPLTITPRSNIGLLGARTLRFFGADPNVTEVPGPVCVPEYEHAAYQALLDDIQATADEWTWTHWSGLPENSVATQVVGGYRQTQWTRSTPVFVLTLPSSWEELRATRGRNIKESIRKSYNALKRDGHKPELVVFDRPDAMREAITRFLRLHTARAQMPDGVPHPDVFALTHARRFLFDVSHAFAETNAMKVFALKIGNEIVAIRLGFIVGDALYLYYSGYNPDWAKYSVMTRLLTEAIKYAIQAGIRRVNLSSGEDVSKTRWGPTTVRYSEGIQIAQSFGARAAHAMYQSAVKIRDGRYFGSLVRPLLSHRFD